MDANFQAFMGGRYTHDPDAANRAVASINANDNP